MELQKITIEQANALKEVGFPLEYEEIEYEEPWGGFNSYISDKPILPSLELVAKWLRTEKEVYIFPYMYCPNKQKVAYTCSVFYFRNMPMKRLSEWLVKDDSHNVIPIYHAYEEALNAGIDSAIEILKENGIN